MENRKRTPLYVSDWEPIAKAVLRIVDEGADEDEAKAALCNAVADKKVAMRVTVHGSKRTYQGENVGVPPHLRPEMIDWQNSRPLETWWIGSMLAWRYYDDGGYKQLELLEVSVPDLTEIFATVAMSKPPRARAGPKPKYDWALIEAEAMRLMDYHGGFIDGDPKWNGQARLEEALATFCQKKFKDEPSKGSLRKEDHIPKWLDNWRAKGRGAD